MLSVVLCTTPRIAAAEPYADIERECLERTPLCAVLDGWMSDTLVYQANALGAFDSREQALQEADREIVELTPLFLRFSLAGGDLVRVNVQTIGTQFEKAGTHGEGDIKWGAWGAQ